MKTFILPIIIAGILFTSCEDFLKEEPKSIAVETFYNTPSEVESALNAIYNPLHPQESMGGNYLALLEACTDYGYGRGSWAQPSDFQGLDNTNISRVNTFWTNFYLAIRNANICISNIPNGAQLTEEQKNIYLGEARFLRAFVYLHLVQNWGGVPLRTEENMNDLAIARSPVENVWELIENDLLFAETNLPEITRAAGCPSRFAAKTVLTEVYLHLKKYPEALTKATEVKNSGKYSLVTLSVPDDFLSKLYGPDLVSSNEEIFYIKFTRASSKGFILPMFAHHPSAGYIGSRGWYGHYSDSEKNLVLKNWDKKDFRYQYNWYLWNTIGLGETSVLNKKYQDKNATSNNSIGCDYPVYRYADLLLYLAEAEARVNGVTNEAIEALNQVHRRAYGYSPVTSSPVDFKTGDFANSDLLIDMIVKERGYETVYEGKRWNDLKRLGFAKKIIKEIKGIDVADKHLLWPIPEVETNYNALIDAKNNQNPGY